MALRTSYRANRNSGAYGLIIAQGLPKRHISHMEVDYGLTTPEGAVHEYITICDLADIQVMKKLPTSSGRRVSRTCLRAVLCGGLEVQYEKKVIGISYSECGVVVRFEDGTEAAVNIF